MAKPVHSSHCCKLRSKKLLHLLSLSNGDTSWNHLTPWTLPRAFMSKLSSLPARGLYTGQVPAPYRRARLTQALCTESLVSLETPWCCQQGLQRDCRMEAARPLHLSGLRRSTSLQLAWFPLSGQDKLCCFLLEAKSGGNNREVVVIELQQGGLTGQQELESDGFTL